jgi:hypothetical protein
MLKFLVNTRASALPGEAGPAPVVEALPEVFAPPEVVQGDGGDADWALWDECVAAWDHRLHEAVAAAADSSAAC